MAFVYPLCSSSSGNSVYVGDRERGILIDAGISGRAFSQALKLQNIPIDAVKAIFVTHEHTDHIKGLSMILSLTRAPVYASEDTLWYLLHNGCIPNDTKVIAMEKGDVLIENLRVKGFYTPHDSISSMCYRFWTDDCKSGVICTDIGHMSNELISEFYGAEFVMLESNYDENLLRAGAYPAFLKRRILSANGHLSNDCCAEALIDLFNNGTTRFMLGHLSKENNRPELAFASALRGLIKTGGQIAVDFTLTVAPRRTTGEIVAV